MTPFNYDLIFYGGPASGKTTQADLLAKSLKAQHISMGDQFRIIAKLNTPLAKKIKLLMSQGKLLPNDSSIAVIDKVVSKTSAGQRLIFDGFPRNVTQAKVLDKYLAKLGRKAIMIYLDVPVDVVVKRLSLRGREDDKSETAVRNRIGIFLKNSQKVIQYYKDGKRLLDVNGNQTISTIHKQLIKQIKTWA